MAEIQAVVSGDITPFERSLQQATEKAREFGRGLGEVGNELTRSFTGFDISKALGITGAIYAATKLGDALVDAAKEGLAAFQRYQDAVLRFKFTMPAMEGVTPAERGARAAEVAETVESKTGIYSFEQLSKAAEALMQASQDLSKSPEKLAGMLDTIKALALKTGGSPEAIAESYRKLAIGLKEEGGGAAARFMKTVPGLEEETRKLQEQRAAEYLERVGVTSPAQLKEGTQASIDYRKIAEANAAEFMSMEAERTGSKGFMEEMRALIERAAPKEIIKEEEALQPFKMLEPVFEQLRKAFGEVLLPAVTDLAKVLKEELPTLTPLFI